MAIKFERTAYSGRISPFWRKERQVLPGGYEPVQTLNVGDVVAEGTFVQIFPDTMKAAIIKIGKVMSGGTTTAIRVTKNNCFAVGDVVMKVGGDSTTTVKSVDRSNSSYDVVEVATAISGIAEGDFLQEADSSAKAPKYVANAVVENTLEVQKSGLPTLDVAYSCVLLKSVIPAIPEAWLIENGFALVANPQIVVINQ